MVTSRISASMSERGYRGRFAPSPTGDLHLGHARTALCAWLAARSAAGHLLMRIEDLDRPRRVPGAEERILEDLAWLGLDWDEGPDVGGPFSPYRQSERLDRYEAAVSQLLSSGQAFPCFCSRAEVARAATAPHGPEDEGPRYPGTCRALSGAQVSERSRTRRPSIRLRVEPGTVTWSDAVFGVEEQDPSESIGDFVLQRSDGIFAYQLAVVVDDAAMEVSEVVRGEDLRSSTARQLLLFRALGLAAPRYLHVPLVLGPDGQRLSKRHGAVGVRALRASGLDPRELVGSLGTSLGLCPPGCRIAPLELVAAFRPGLLLRTPLTWPGL